MSSVSEQVLQLIIDCTPVAEALRRAILSARQNACLDAIVAASAITNRHTPEPAEDHVVGADLALAFAIKKELQRICIRVEGDADCVAFGQMQGIFAARGVFVVTTTMTCPQNAFLVPHHVCSRVGVRNV